MFNQQRKNKYALFNIKSLEEDFVVALVGNPNTGKSTIFNTLTGLRQHTGNWPGKTVTNASGRFVHNGNSFLLVDLPGTYSLLANSADEIAARDFVCFGKPDATVVVADATNLERNLNLTLQVMEATDNVVLCINLLDEAEKKGIKLNLDKLSTILGVPVVGTIARNETGIQTLKNTLYNISLGLIKSIPVKIKYSKEIEDLILEIMPKLKKIINQEELDLRWIALRLLEGDETIIDSIEYYLNNNFTKFESVVAICPK